MPSFSSSIHRQVPFLSFLIPLLLGIVAGWYLIPFPVFYPLSTFFILAAFFFILVLLNRIFGIKGKKMVSVGVFMFLFFFGCFLSWWHNERLSPDFAGRYLKDSSLVKIRLETPLTEKPNTWKAGATILSVRNGKQLKVTQGHALVYFKKDSIRPDLKYGDVLMIPNKLVSIKNSGNPGGFDYERYCRAKNIAYSAYLQPNSWTILQKNVGNKIKSFFLKARQQCIQILQRFIPFQREAAVAKALLLGYRADLNPKLVQAYANVGVVHLIAISGLHVGLIYVILLWIFKLLPRKTKWLQGILIGVSLWSFALLTGAHPSTLRATVMFSFFIVGEFFFNRKGDSLNVLLASAFMLLCYNPYLLFDVGFQLSYLAVGGILLFQKPIQNLLWSPYKIIQYCWEMTAVSLSAQVLVFPLVLYYFHQFPTIFILSNLLLIPAASLALYGEVALLLLSFISVLGKIVGWMVGKILFFINESVLWANQLPFVKWEYYHLTVLKLLILYFLVGFIVAWLFYKHKKVFILGLVALLGLFLIGILHRWKNLNQKKIIVYNTPRLTNYELVAGDRSQLFSDSLSLSALDMQQYTFQPAKEALNLTNRVIKESMKPFFSFYDHRFMIVDADFCPKDISGIFPLDYVILSHYNHLSMKDIARHFSPKAIIFDASVYKWQAEKWKSACKKLNLHCFSVTNKGAWSLSIK